MQSAIKLSTNKARLAGAGLLILAIGFAAGVIYQTREAKALITGLHEHDLSNLLMALRYLDRKEVGDARKLLEASTSGHLTWIMEGTDPKEGDSLCATLNTLKAYRAKHKLFSGEQWAEYLALPGVEEEEKKRARFLEGISCGSRVLYRME